MKARQRYSFEHYYLIIYYSWSVMVRFTAIQTDGFKSNNLPSTKIAYWTNKKTPSSAAYLVIQSIFSFTPLLRQLQDARFGYCPTLSQQSLRKARKALQSELAGGRGAVQVTPYQGTATRPLWGTRHSGFSLQVRQCTDSAFPSFIKTTLVRFKYLSNTIRYNDAFIIIS